MDYKKIGNFITSERKAKKLTQEKLSEKLFVSEKTVSKWENGKGIPETSLLTGLCEIFDVSINELLNGERIEKENYVKKAEDKLLELQNFKQQSDKRLLSSEIVIGVLSAVFLFSMIFIASFIEMQDWLRITLICLGFVVFVSSMFFAIRIEQVAGYYVCQNCNHKYIPTYKQVFWAMHVNRTRYMKCPHCHKKSWSKKVVN